MKTLEGVTPNGEKATPDNNGFFFNKEQLNRSEDAKNQLATKFYIDLVVQKNLSLVFFH